MNERKQKVFNDWVFRSKSLNILIFGKIGAGKSSLINTLLREQVAEEGAGLYSVTKNVEAYTRSIKPTEKIINNIRISLWDTPGLRDPFSDGKKTLDGIRDVFGDIDLFLFCTRMDQTRLSQDDVDAIRDLTEALGEGIWKRAIFALTFANKTYPSSGQQNPDYLKAREQEWQGGLQKVVRRYTNNVITSKIPVIPTGYKEEPLPDGREWFTPFWEACLARVRYDSIPALLRVNKDGWQNNKTRRHISALMIADRLKHIGDHLEEDLDPQIRHAIAQIGSVRDLDVMGLMATAIQFDETNVLSRTFREVGHIWNYGNTLVVVIVAILSTVLVQRYY